MLALAIMRSIMHDVIVLVLSLRDDSLVRAREKSTSQPGCCWAQGVHLALSVERADAQAREREVLGECVDDVREVAEALPAEELLRHDGCAALPRLPNTRARAYIH